MALTRLETSSYASHAALAFLSLWVGSNSLQALIVPHRFQIFAFFSIMFGMGQLSGWTCRMLYVRPLFCTVVVLNQVLRVVTPTALDSSLRHDAHLRPKVRHHHQLPHQYAPLGPDPSCPNTTCQRSAVECTHLPPHSHTTTRSG